MCVTFIKRQCLIKIQAQSSIGNFSILVAAAPLTRNFVTKVDQTEPPAKDWLDPLQTTLIKRVTARNR